MFSGVAANFFACKSLSIHTGSDFLLSERCAPYLKTSSAAVFGHTRGFCFIALTHLRTVSMLSSSVCAFSSAWDRKSFRPAPGVRGGRRHPDSHEHLVGYPAGFGKREREMGTGHGNGYRNPRQPC